jgi:hypothetical protein
MFLGLLDTGSVRSFISYDHFMQLQQQDPGLRAVDTKVECKSASRHQVDIVGEVNLLVKVEAGTLLEISFLNCERSRMWAHFGDRFYWKDGVSFGYSETRILFAF